YPTEGGAVVAGVEHGNVPVAPQATEKVEQGAGALGEFEAVHHLVAGGGHPPPHHVANMYFGHLVVGHVRHRVAVAAQGGHQVVPVPIGFHLHTDEDMGLGGVAHTVVELGDHAPVNQLAELAEAAGLLGDGD